jgi:endonuclease/exonuclease/phosphatase family metal-dependent hydrolase
MVLEVCTRGRAVVVLGMLAALIGAPQTAHTQGTADGEIALLAKDASVVQGRWTIVGDQTAAGGARLWNRDDKAPKLATPLASPASFFELTFNAEANRGYRLWIRGRADLNSWTNDSVYAQFSGAVSATGTPVYQIGTTSATWLSIEDCSGCGVQGWGWQDNGYGTGVLGPLVYFAQSGPQTLRIQQREDGISIDQVVLSPARYLAAAPGATTNDATLVAEPIAPPPTTQAVVHDEVMIGAGAPTAVSGAWRLVTDSTAANSVALSHPDAGAAKVAAPRAAPVDYVELTFEADAGKPYRLWLRARADGNYWANDSVFVQFTNSLNAAGAPALRIGSTDAFVVNLEDAADARVSGWGWQDTGYGAGVLGPLVTFATSGTQTIRIQTREDGVRFDQVVLSAVRYLSVAPGALKNDATIVVPVTTPPPPVPVAAPVVVPPPSTGVVRIRVLQWNLHHGVGTDGRYDIDRIATWMASMTPDIVFLNEVEKYTGWGNENQPERYRALLEAKTGKRWYSHFAQEYGSWSSNGKGSEILSTFPLDSTDMTTLSYTRVIAAATVTVNGRILTLMETHLDPDSQAYRLTQAKQVITWALARPENRIIAGDFNAWPDQSSIAEMRKTYLDSWEQATAIGKAFTFAGNNPIGATKNGRIDYIFYSRGASNLKLIESRVVDTRNASGVMPSDHRPVVSTFEVR